MDKRYQVFVSSTYADLKEERRRVIQTVMELDCIPAGMELFPAADQDQFEFIKRVIDDCDYYLVIIGGKYGSLTDTGISYTEQEYDYAVSRGLKVIALLHENPDDIPLGKSEKDPELRERLQAFRDRVARGRLVKFWKNAENLPGLVALSLSNAMKMFPAVGWIRANKAANEDVLGEINELRKQNTALQSKVTELSGEPLVAIADLAGLDEEINVYGDYSDRRGKHDWSGRATWREIFGYISPYLERYPTDENVKAVLASALFAKTTASSASIISLNDQLFQTIFVQMKSLGLVSITYSRTDSGGVGFFWSLTPAGKRLMVELRTIRTQTPAAK